MVGDSDVDILTAKRASVPIVMVSFGYVRPSLDAMPPDAIIDDFDQLAPEVSALLAASIPAKTGG